MDQAMLPNQVTILLWPIDLRHCYKMVDIVDRDRRDETPSTVQPLMRAFYQDAEVNSHHATVVEAYLAAHDPPAEAHCSSQTRGDPGCGHVDQAVELTPTRFISIDA
jgi:hypothetical protein